MKWRAVCDGGRSFLWRSTFRPAGANNTYSYGRGVHHNNTGLVLGTEEEFTTNCWSGFSSETSKPCQLSVQGVLAPNWRKVRRKVRRRVVGRGGGNGERVP